MVDVLGALVLDAVDGGAVLGALDAVTALDVLVVDAGPLVDAGVEAAAVAEVVTGLAVLAVLAVGPVDAVVATGVEATTPEVDVGTGAAAVLPLEPPVDGAGAAASPDAAGAELGLANDCESCSIRCARSATVVRPQPKPRP
jgi:hypothetical protein